MADGIKQEQLTEKLEAEPEACMDQEEGTKNWKKAAKLGKLQLDATEHWEGCSTSQALPGLGVHFESQSGVPPENSASMASKNDIPGPSHELSSPTELVLTRAQSSQLHISMAGSQSPLTRRHLTCGNFVAAVRAHSNYAGASDFVDKRLAARWAHLSKPRTSPISVLKTGSINQIDAASDHQRRSVFSVSSYSSSTTGPSRMMSRNSEPVFRQTSSQSSRSDVPLVSMVSLPVSRVEDHANKLLNRDIYRRLSIDIPHPIFPVH